MVFKKLKLNNAVLPWAKLYGLCTCFAILLTSTVSSKNPIFSGLAPVIGQFWSQWVSTPNVASRLYLFILKQCQVGPCEGCFNGKWCWRDNYCNPLVRIVRSILHIIISYSFLFFALFCIEKCEYACRLN